MSTSYLDWSLWGGGGLLLFIGVRLLIWALIGDRAKGRLRCPKCWGDMGGVEPVEGVWSCPQCKKQVPSKTKLQRSKKRWRWVIVALIVIPAAIGVMMIPTALHRNHSGTDIALWTGGWTVLLLGTLLLGWSIVGDRAKGRKRCPKCWYNMASIEHIDGGRTCPECGRAIARERGLSKARRRWRVALASCLILLVGYATLLTPRVRERGWPAAVPTTALILGLPVVVHDLELMVFDMTQSEDPRDRLYLDLLRRLQDDNVWRWQQQLIARIALHNGLKSQQTEWERTAAGYFPLLRNCAENSNAWSGSLRERLMRVVYFQLDLRSTWVRGEPIYAFIWLWPLIDLGTTEEPSPRRLRLRPDRDGLDELIFFEQDLVGRGYRSQAWSDDLTPIGAVQALGPIAFDLVIDYLDADSQQWFGIFTKTDAITIEFKDSIHQLLYPKRNSVDDQLFDKHFASMLYGGASGYWLQLISDYGNLMRTARASPTGTTFAVRIDLLADGQAVSRTSYWEDDAEEALRRLGLNLGAYFPLDVTDEILVQHRDASWTVRLTPDPLLALRRFDATSYWDGEVEIAVGIDKSVWEHLDARSSDDP